MGMTIGPRMTQPPAMTPGGMPRMGPGGVGDERRATGLGGSVRVTVSPHGGVADVSSVNAAIEADITTNDALGGLFKAAFNLPAPAMPEGLKG